MAEEPQPPITPGADAPDVLPANAEDLKAARALSSLDAKPDDNALPKKEVDLKALGEAMKSLDFSQKSKQPTTAKKAKEEEAPKAPIKVNPADVTLLVEQLDLSKGKATDLLRAHDADTVRYEDKYAVGEWINPLLDRYAGQLH